MGQETRQLRRISPRPGLSMPAIRRSRVDFPAPLRPSKPTLTPFGKLRLTSLSTQSLPW